MIDSAWLEAEASRAVRHFWRSRRSQQKTQGARTGRKDAGSRGAVTGGKQLDGFARVIADIVCKAGISKDAVRFTKRNDQFLPGFFRAEKNWDLLVIAGGKLLACVEFKSQVGSFGNNFNNRTEEAIGNAHDFWIAYREGAFQDSPRPWLGYIMLLEEAPGSTRPVSVKEPHFDVFPEFKAASYAERYRLLMQRLIRERMYDSTALILSNQKDGSKGRFNEPDPDVGFKQFGASLYGHAVAHVAELE